MLHPGHIGLGRVGKQVWLSWTGLCQQARQVGLVDAEVERLKRHIGDGSTLGLSKFADAVHRVMIIKGEQIVAT